MSQITNFENITGQEIDQILSSFSVDSFKFAVSLLYKSKVSEYTKKADTFFIQFEKSNEAWDIAFQILNLPELDEEAHFNATQIIKKKLKYDFAVYIQNKDVIFNIGKILVEKIEQYKSSKTYLLSNLCKCFSLFAIFAHVHIPDILNGIVSKLYLQNPEDSKSLFALLLIFSYIAEDIVDENIVVDREVRESFEKLLESIADEVVKFLTHLVIMIRMNKAEVVKNDPKQLSFFDLMNKNIIECFTNWTNVGLPGQTLSKLPKDYVELMNFIFDLKTDEGNLEAHAECICLLLRLPLQNEQMRELSQFILGRVINLKDSVLNSIKSEDEDEVKFFYDIFEQLIQNNLEEILSSGNLEILQLLMNLSINSHYERISNICNFWGNFLNSLTREYNYSNEEIETRYGIILNPLMKGLFKLLKFDKEIFNKLNKVKTRNVEDDESYKATDEFRIHIREFLQKYTDTFGFVYFYKNLFEPVFQETINAIRVDMESEQAWAWMECLIYILMCTCRSNKCIFNLGFGKKQNLQMMDAMFQAIFETPEKYIQIKRTVTYFLDEMGGLLGNSPEILIKSFNYLISGLENPLLLTYCSLSLKTLLSDNKAILFTNKADLLQLYNNKVKDKVIKSGEFRSVLEGVVEVITYGDDAESMKADLVGILLPFVSALTEAKSNHIPSQKELNSKEINMVIDILDVLKSISRSAYSSVTSQNNYVLSQIFYELYPLLEFFLSTFPKFYDLTEAITQLIKNYMRGMKNEFKPFLERYSALIIQGFKIVPNPSYIYAFEVIASVFCSEEEVQPLLLNILKELVIFTFTHYLKNEDDFNNNPHLSEDFFGMLYRLIRLNPVLIINFEHFSDLLYACICNIGIVHIESGRNIIFFLNKIFDFNEDVTLRRMDAEKAAIVMASIRTNVEKYGQEIANRVIAYLLTVPPKLVFENLEEMITHFIQNFSNIAPVVFFNALKTVPHDCLTDSEKEKFIKALDPFNQVWIEEFLILIYKRSLSRSYRQQSINKK
jgi:transportin-3